MDQINIVFGTYPCLAGWVVLAVVFAVSGLWLVRHFCGHEVMQSHHAVAGPFLSIIATLYAVVLGFIVVDALNTFQKSRMIVEQEANAVHDIFHLSQGLSEPTRSDLRKLCIEYADTMVNYEWPAMEIGKLTDQGHMVFTRIWHDLTRYKPQNSGEGTYLDNLLQEVRLAGDARHSRLLAASATFDPMIWLLLGVGSIVTIVFTYFFGVPNFRVQAVMTALVTIVVTLNLVVVALFDTPFSGDVKVSPRAFQAELKLFREEANEQ
jgi:Protein of unknown function (DUF4239)